MAPTLAYYKLRGLAQPIRLLLAQASVKYNDKYYEINDNQWFGRDKQSLGLDFPNLPYYIDGEVKVTQSLTILRYLARKYNLAGRNEKEQLRIELAEQQLADNVGALGRTINSPDYETLKVDLLKDLPASLQLLSDFLGAGQFFAGDNISYIDFLAYEYFFKLSLFAPDIFNKYENLKAFVSRIERQPKIEAYIKSNDYISKPFSGPQAKWDIK